MTNDGMNGKGLIKIFVYGTLRKHKSNNVLLEKSKYLGDYRTIDKFIMTSNGYIPFVSDAVKYSHIKGEIYSVSPSVLKVIDNLEGHPHWYRRKKIKVTNNNGKSFVNVFIYINDNVCRLIYNDGDFNNKERDNVIPISLSSSSFFF